jgi:S-DNA-T family DNA segregation ATPase FtsK/SpoIIIE
LGELVALDEVLARWPEGVRDPRDAGRTAVLGLCDDPENQAQRVAAVDLEASGGLLVFGTGGSGKTTVLRTIAAALAAQGDADEVRIYGLDFASRGLGALAGLPQCGEVVPGDDVERVTRLLTVLAREIDARRTTLAAAQAETLGALRASDGAPMVPRIVVLVDGYGGFHSAFDRADGYEWLTRFQQIVSTGRQVGVHLVIASERRTGVPAAVLSAVSARLALRMATAEELMSLGAPSVLARGAELPPGRGYLDGSGEVQVAFVGRGGSGAAQAAALAALGDRLRAAGATRAPALPVLPRSVSLTDAACDPPLGVPGRGCGLTAVLGLADLTLEVARVDLARRNLLVAGPPLSGRSTVLETVARGLRASNGAELFVAGIGGAASPLAALDLWDDAAFARAVQPGLVERLAAWLAGEEGVDARAVLVVDVAEDLDGADVLRPLETLARVDALRLVVACEPTTVAKAYSGWLAALRRNRTALVLQPESRAEVEATVGVRTAWRPGQEFPPGRGLLVAERTCTLVQVGLA